MPENSTQNWLHNSGPVANEMWLLNSPKLNPLHYKLSNVTGLSQVRSKPKIIAKLNQMLQVIA